MRNLPPWVLPAVIVAAAAVAYVLDFLPERSAGAALAFALVLLPAPYAAFRVAHVAPSGGGRGALFGVAGLSALLAAVAIYGALFPGEARYTGQLSKEQQSVPIGSVAGGAYLLVVEGVLPEREGEVTIEYKLRLGTADKKDITGELWRRFDQVRSRRGTATQEVQHTTGKHTVFVGEGQGEVALVSVSPEIPLSFRLHKILLPMSAFVVACALLFAIGAFLEGRFGNDRVRGLMATTLAFTGCVGFLYPDQISDTALVRPAIGVGVTSFFFAVLIGGAIAAILRKILRPKVDA